MSQAAEDGRYFLDGFSGSGGVAKAVRRQGFTAKEFELLHGEEFDLTRPCVLNKICRDAKDGRLIAAAFGPPCASWSIARDRTLVIRNQLQPWGLDNLPENEQVKVEAGNKTLRATLKLIRTLHRLGIPWSLENPGSSKMWWTKELKEIMTWPGVHEELIDFCQYGTAWRKRTRFIFGNVQPENLGRFNHRRCTGTGGFCSRTGERHFQLTGTSPTGVPWTRIAQPYPTKLCNDLAHILVDAERVKYMEKTWLSLRS